MITVKLSTSTPLWPYIRQTPQGSGVWGRCKFVVDEEIDECDFWVVYADITDLQRCRCDPDNVLYIAGEPPSKKKYPRKFLAQFETVWTTDRETDHPNRLFVQPCLPWHTDIDRHADDMAKTAKTFDQFVANWPVPKTKTLSLISSNLTNTPIHVKRLAFIRSLQEHFGPRLDVFGRGLNEVGDKADAIAPYRYHIVLEPSNTPDYWTEKLSDAYLCGALPFYWGCPNIGDYFPETALIPINMDDATEAIATIEATLAADPYEERLADVEEARRRVLYEFNLYAQLERAFVGRPIGPKKMVTIIPERWFRNRSRMFRKLAKVTLRDGVRGIGAKLGWGA